ncbi:MAG: hypothetical protein JST04_17680 [Bdellovibrionales bacterium]|nr:hypothetical protein [Bdellovibrionales bacterium]
MGTLRFTMAAAISAVFVLSACSPNAAFERSASFTQEDHIDGDIPQVPGDPSNPGNPKNPEDPAPVASPSPKPSSPAPVPSVMPSVRPSPAAEPPKKECDKDKDNNEYDDDSPVPAYARCGNKLEKVLVCHVPPGNPAAAHTICISVNGAVHGHDVPLDGSISPVSGDYIGECMAPAAPASSKGKGKK